MRLDAVYLVAPVPKPPSVPTRRAFLVAGATFCAGLGLGGACGYAVGVGRGAGPAGEEELPTTGNAELDELRRLAVQAPIEELVEKWLYFLDSFAQHYRRDEVLPRGVARLADHVLATPGLPQRRAFATAIAQVIELAEASVQDELSSRAVALRKLR